MVEIKWLCERLNMSESKKTDPKWLSDWKSEIDLKIKSVIPESVWKKKSKKKKRLPKKNTKTL